MQTIKVKEIREVRGKTGKIFYAVTDDKGGEFTTFDPNIIGVNPGSLLEIEPQVAGKYINLGEWKVLEEPKKEEVLVPTPPIEGKQPYGKTPAQFEAERHSIEAQVAFKGMIDLIGIGREMPEDLINLVFNWARVRLGGIPAPKQPIQKKPSSQIGEYSPSLVKDDTDLSPDASQSAAEPVEKESKAVAQEETKQTAKSDKLPVTIGKIDREWLIDSINKLHLNLTQYIKDTFQIKAVGKETLLDVVKKLSEDQQTRLEAEIKERLKML